MIAALRLSCVFGLAALTLAGTAYAQTPKKPLPSPEGIEIAAMHGYARCIVAQSSEGAVKVLERDYRTKEYAEALTRLAKGHDRCTVGKVRISGVLFAGALAEGLIRKDHEQATFTALLRTPEPALTARSEVEYTGMCLALAYPKKASALLFSDPASSEAQAMISGLAPYLANCVHKGQTLRINKAGLRAITALAAYRLAGVNSATGKI